MFSKCAILSIFVISPLCAQAEKKLTENELKLLNRPMATCMCWAPSTPRIVLPGFSPRKLTLWEYHYKLGTSTRPYTNSLVILTRCDHDSPTADSIPIWISKSSKDTGPIENEECTWDVAFHSETSKAYIVRLLSKGTRGEYDLNLYEVDVRGKKVELGAYTDITKENAASVKIPEVEELSQYQGDIPKTRSEKLFHHINVVNPKIQVHPKHLLISFSRFDQSTTVSLKYDLKTKKWSKAK